MEIALLGPFTHGMTEVVMYTSLALGYPKYPVSAQGTSCHFWERSSFTHSADVWG